MWGPPVTRGDSGRAIRERDNVVADRPYDTGGHTVQEDRVALVTLFSLAAF